MIAADDPNVEEYRELYESMADAELHTLHVSVNVPDVEEGNCAGVQAIMMCLQHFPNLIEKMIFSFVIDFVEDEKTEIVLPEETWKSEPVFYNWFHKLLGTPFVLFFIADEDARYYTLMGDMIQSGALETEIDERSGRTGFSFDKEQGEEIVRRVWGSCFNMMQFCYGSGFDPRIYIEGMMALLGVQFTYEELEQSFKEFLEKGAYRLVRQ